MNRDFATLGTDRSQGLRLLSSAASSANSGIDSVRQIGSECEHAKAADLQIGKRQSGSERGFGGAEFHNGSRPQRGPRHGGDEQIRTRALAPQDFRSAVSTESILKSRRLVRLSEYRSALL